MTALLSFLIDIPEAPANFTIISSDSDDHSIELNWIASRDTVNSSDEVEDYVLEQRLNGDAVQLVRKFIISSCLYICVYTLYLKHR